MDSPILWLFHRAYVKYFLKDWTKKRNTDGIDSECSAKTVSTLPINAL